VQNVSLPFDDTMSLPLILAWIRINLNKMLLGGAICALLATPVVIFTPKMYQSTVTLLVSPPTFKDREKPPVSRDPKATIDNVAEMMPRILPMETYKALAFSPPLMAQVIDNLSLKDTGVKSLKSRLDVELVALGSRTAVGITYAPTIMFHAKADTPEMAAKIAETWAESFQKMVDGVSDAGVGETLSLLDSLHKNAKAELEQAETALAEHEKAWNLELIKAQIEGKQKTYTQFEQDLKQAEVDLAAAEMKLKAMEEELGKEPEKKTFFRAPSDDAYWIAGVGKEGAKNAEPGLRTEESNPNYTGTRNEVVKARGEAESLRAKKDSIVVKLGEIDQEIKPLMATLADKTAERNKLTREGESLKASYEVVRAEFERGRMADRTRASDIVIAGKAIPATEPVTPSSRKLIFAAGFVGILLTAAFLVLKKLSYMVPLPDEKQKAA
jgi:capsular polysaccharide biosynthesis protein